VTSVEPSGAHDPILAMIVDDETPGRDLIKELLSNEESFQVVAECGDGAEALTMIDRLRPEVVFLDVRMPHVDGLKTAMALGPSGPVVVFVTAHDEHALAAFEARGFDYLLKPVAKKRFRTVIARVRQEVRKRRLESAYVGGEGELPARAAPRAAGTTFIDRIRIRSGHAIKYVSVNDIVWIEGANQYVNVHTPQTTFVLSSETLAGLEQKLDPRMFFRVHRSAIVNKAYVAGAQTDSSGAIILSLSQGSRVRVSRRHRAGLADLLLRAM
jgi:two-component system LytT family response regulator